MAKELRCSSCEGELAWAGAQVSCRGCGKVYTMAGKPGSKLGVLVVGVGIGLILGFIGAYELNRFVLGVQQEEKIVEVESEGTEEVVDGSMSLKPEDPMSTKSEFQDPYMDGAEFSAFKSALHAEANMANVVAETSGPTALFELHTSMSAGERSWVFGQLTNRSAVTIRAGKIFAVEGKGTQEVPKQDYFYGEMDCLAPGESEWVKGLVDFTSTEGLSFEVYPEAATFCPRPLQHLVVTHDVKVNAAGKRVVFGHVKNQEDAPVQFVQVYANVFEGTRLVAQESTYLQGVMSPGTAQRFQLALPAGNGKIEVTTTGRYYRP
jgi:hypothetical protein